MGPNPAVLSGFREILPDLWGHKDSHRSQGSQGFVGGVCQPQDCGVSPSPGSSNSRAHVCPLFRSNPPFKLYGLTSHPYDQNLSFRKTRKASASRIWAWGGRWTSRNVGTIYFGQAERWVPFILL